MLCKYIHGQYKFLFLDLGEALHENETTQLRAALRDGGKEASPRYTLH